MVNLIGRDRRGRAALPALSAHAESLLAARIEVASRLCDAADPDLPLARRHRTPSLEPDIEDEPSLAGLEAALHELAQRRAAASGAKRDPIRAGRAAASSEVSIVLVQLNASAGDGRAEAASRGFFDVDDLPPWDLWLIGFGQSRPGQPDAPEVCLAALVPAACRELVEAGVAACGSGCLHLAAGR